MSGAIFQLSTRNFLFFLISVFILDFYNEETDNL